MDQPTTNQIAEALRDVAPGLQSLRALGEALNEQLGTDKTAAAWRGLWKRNPDLKEQAQRIMGQAGTAVNGDEGHERNLTIVGDVRGAVTSDEHVPFHDQQAVMLACRILAWWKPQVLVLNGDQMDFYQCSRFDKNPARQFTLQDEIDTWHREALGPMREAVGGSCRIVKVDGNHEDRLRKHLWKSPELFGLRSLQMENLLELDKYGVDYSPDFVRFGEVLEVSHGYVVRKWGGTSARGEAESRRYGISTITGHVHRAGVFDSRTRDGWIQAYENPCLCGLDPEYMVNPDWRQGLTLFDVRDGEVWINAVKFTASGRACVGGRWFE